MVAVGSYESNHGSIVQVLGKLTMGIGFPPRMQRVVMNMGSGRPQASAQGLIYKHSVQCFSVFGYVQF